MAAAGGNLVRTGSMVGAGNVVRNGVVDASAVPHTEPYGPTRRHAAEDKKADACGFDHPHH